jgi:hypothetical protein
MKLRLNRLERDETLRELRYHLKGIAEAADNVARLVKRMNETYKRDADEYAKASTLLEVEVFDHLEYHIKQLRAPLRRVQHTAYAEAGGTTAKASSRKRRKTTE